MWSCNYTWLQILQDWNVATCPSQKFKHESIIGYRGFSRSADGTLCLSMENGEKSLMDLIEMRSENGEGKRWGWMLPKGSIISLAKLPSFTPRIVFLVAGASDRTQKFPTSFEIKASSDPYLSDTYQTHFLLGDIFVKKIRMLSSIAVKLDMVLILIHKCYYCCVWSRQQ